MLKRLVDFRGSRPYPARYPRNVERLTQADRVCAVAAAAAHDLNDELTIIINGAAQSIELLEADHPALEFISQLQNAAQRSIWKASGLLNYGIRRGVRPVPVAMERLILEAE